MAKLGFFFKAIIRHLMIRESAYSPNQLAGNSKMNSLNRLFTKQINNIK